MTRYAETRLRTLTKALLLRVIVFTIITLATVFIFKQSAHPSSRIHPQRHQAGKRSPKHQAQGVPGQDR